MSFGDDEIFLIVGQFPGEAGGIKRPSRGIAGGHGNKKFGLDTGPTENPRKNCPSRDH